MTRLLIATLVSLCALVASAQPCGGVRYQQRVFAQSYKTSNVTYGNAPSLTSVYLGENVTQNIDLTLDVFEPFGDTLQKRPLVIMAFGGAFLIGSKDDGDMQAVCDSLARRGYVTASINYRLGMNVADGASAERAIYRSLQDFSAAVRYFKEFADQYRIDTNYIYAGGVSAGGFAAMHMAFMDESDRLPSSFGAGGLTPRPDLGCKDCSGNNYAHSSKVRGLVSFWGALGDVNFIKPSNVLPLVSFHGDQDLIVPYGTGYPFTALFVLPQVSGSSVIKQRYDQLGAYNDFTTMTGEGHNVWGLVVTNVFTPNQYFQPIYQHTAQFLYEQTRPLKPIVQGADSVCSNIVSTYTVTALPNETYCWQVQGGQIVAENGNQISVHWANAGTGKIMVSSENHLKAVSAIDTFNVLVRSGSAASIDAPEGTVVCSGSVLPFIATNPAMDYEWMPASYFSNGYDDSTLLLPLISGLYYLQTTDSYGCLSKDSIYVTVKPSPLMPIIQQVGDTLVADGGTGSFTWLDANEQPIDNGNMFLPTTDGTYYLAETGDNGCTMWSLPYEYARTGIAYTQLIDVEVYPNPTKGRLEIETSYMGVFKIYGVDGKQVLTQSINGNSSINLSEMAAGIYYYEFASPHGIKQGKLVKQ